MPGKSNRRTGTRQKTGKVSLRTLGKDTLKQLAKEEHTTALSWSAPNTTHTILTSTPLGSSPKGAPGRPKVDIGPKAYMTYKSGARAVIRFFVRDKRGRWFVMDMCSSGPLAAKTLKDGYATKKEAVEVARKYRDKYGAYAKVPF